MRPFFIAPVAAALTAAALLAAPAVAAAPTIKVDHPWSRPAAQGGVGVGYLVIGNTGKAADKLASASTPVAQRVEIHQSMEMNGKAMMHPQPGGVAIPAGGQTAFAPGGYHLMFIGLKQPLAIGQSFPVTLRFAKAGAMTVDFKVEKPS